MGNIRGCFASFFGGKTVAYAQLVSDTLSASGANSLIDNRGQNNSDPITMPSVSHAFGNLYHSVAEILGGLLNSILAVFQSIFALAVNTVEAFFAILRALFTGVVDLMSSAVGFVIGASTVQLHSSFPLRLIIYSSYACRKHLHSYCPWCCVLVLRDADAARTGDSSGRQGEVEALKWHWKCRIICTISMIAMIVMSSDSRILNLVRIDSSHEALFGRAV